MNYELFENLVNAKNSNNDKDFKFYAIHLAEVSKENPYEKDTEEARIFSQLYGQYLSYSGGRVGDKAAVNNIVLICKRLLSVNSVNPYKKEEPKKVEEVKVIEQPKKEETVEEPAEITKEELKEDINYLLANMVNAHLRNDNVSYEMYVIQLMEIADENPFLIGTDEYEMFSTMKACFTHNPPNKRRTFVVGKELCDLINNTELYPEKVEKKTVLGVLPDEKKSWFKFLHPWRKDESDDSSGAD